MLKSLKQILLAPLPAQPLRPMPLDRKGAPSPPLNLLLSPFCLQGVTSIGPQPPAALGPFWGKMH